MLAARAVDDARRFLRSLRSFHRRRIDIAVGPSDVAWENWAATHQAPAALFK